MTTRTNHTRMAAALLLASTALLASGCSDDGDGGDGEPIVTITNQWTDEDDATHNFQFNSDEDGQVAGTFEGFESVNDGAIVYDLAGSWADGVIEFTVERAVPVTYTATVTQDNPTRLVFTSVAGELVLLRGN